MLFDSKANAYKTNLQKTAERGKKPIQKLKSVDV